MWPGSPESVATTNGSYFVSGRTLDELNRYSQGWEHWYAAVCLLLVSNIAVPVLRHWLIDCSLVRLIVCLAAYDRLLSGMDIHPACLI